ncbi:MBL fold metallo-hydrolase [Chengkuizengella axinellae]|uniref:MBL fold metallo-hydrolase n=1 Tax=Chengkuizengella axinellae TaxID=3064388 RepID=A0ABT9J5M7_9BACL|nr:MBL fold metallo-hydrolase [Chengkuizengella sp. 2205SS18-9]MDP5276254.1 MBL fold metallo-hydrolase [Chengkuizengella sp. 2205SS18-9]
MKVTKVSEHIYSLKTWLGFPIHVWIVVEEDGVTLVDAGMPVMSKGILNFIDELKAGPLKRIVLTHGHGDHVGAIEKILKVNSVPVFAHSSEFPYMEGDMPYPRRKKAAESVKKGVAQPLPTNDKGELLAMGQLVPYHTPGHAPGHVVYYHKQDQVILAGDLFTSKNGKLHRPIPMFTADMQEAVRSSEVVRQLKPVRLEVCHGNPVFNPVDHLDEYIAKTTEAVS